MLLSRSGDARTEAALIDDEATGDRRDLVRANMAKGGMGWGIGVNGIKCIEWIQECDLGFFHFFGRRALLEESRCRPGGKLSSSYYYY